MIRAQAVFSLAALIMYLTLLVLSRHILGRVFGALGTVLFAIQLHDAWRNVRTGDAPSITMTPDGMAAHRRDRDAFAPWSAIDEARAARSSPQRATTIRIRFTDPAVARSMRRLRPSVPVVRNPRWHLYWSVAGTGVEGDDLAEAIRKCAHDPAARAMVGTEQGLSALGLRAASAPGS